MSESCPKVAQFTPTPTPQVASNFGLVLFVYFELFFLVCVCVGELFYFWASLMKKEAR